MNPQQLRGLEQRLERFLAEMTAPLGREERRHWAGMYTRGLLLDGERKSIEPLAQRVNGGNVQAMQQFIGQSPWAAEQVQELLNRRLDDVLSAATYWLVDETSFPKQGKHSVGVARQYCGSLGKIANCQVAVSLHWSTEDFSFPLGWRLYLPESWVNDTQRRRKSGVPEAIGFQSKPDLGLALLDQALAWGLRPGIVLSDSGYGDSYQWRAALRKRTLTYCVQVEGKTGVWRKAPGRNRMPRPISLTELARRLPAKAWRTLTWREGSKGKQRSRFAMVVVWAAHGWRPGEQIVRVPETVLIEWPAGSDQPEKFWLSNLSPKEGLRPLVRTAKARWRIELDYRQLKEELGLDHFEGRSWLGWHHHVTMVTLAYAFLRLEQACIKKNGWCDFASDEATPAAAADPPERPLPVVPKPV